MSRKSFSKLTALALSTALIGSAAALPQEKIDKGSRANILGSMLYTNVSVDFYETPAREAFAYLREQMDTPMIIHYETINTEGIDPEFPITFQAENTPALVVIQGMLEQCDERPDGYDDNAWQINTDYRQLEIGTKNRLAKNRDVVLYDVKDMTFPLLKFTNAPDFKLSEALSQPSGSSGGVLLFDNPVEEPERPSSESRAEELVYLITNLVEWKGWDRNGGDWAKVSIYQGSTGDSLIIDAPYFMHRAISGIPEKPIRPQKSIR